jgi:hypothetical protein
MSSIWEDAARIGNAGYSAEMIAHPVPGLSEHSKTALAELAMEPASVSR